MPKAQRLWSYVFQTKNRMFLLTPICLECSFYLAEIWRRVCWQFSSFASNASLSRKLLTLLSLKKWKMCLICLDNFILHRALKMDQKVEKYSIRLWPLLKATVEKQNCFHQRWNFLEIEGHAVDIYANIRQVFNTIYNIASKGCR